MLPGASLPRNILHAWRDYPRLPERTSASVAAWMMQRLITPAPNLPPPPRASAAQREGSGVHSGAASAASVASAPSASFEACGDPNGVSMSLSSGSTVATNLNRTNGCRVYTGKFEDVCLKEVNVQSSNFNAHECNNVCACPKITAEVAYTLFLQRLM